MQVSTPVRSGPREQPGHRGPGWHDWALAVGLGLIALALCLIQLGFRGINFSESVSIHIAQRPGLRDLFRDGGEMVAYYSLLKMWTVLGHTEWVVRLPSALFAAASVPLLYLLARRLFNRFVALSAGFLLILNASFVRYGQLARGFSMEMLAVVAGWLVLSIALERRTVAWFAAFGLLGVLAVAAHPVGIFFVAAQAVSLLLLEPRTVPWRRVLGGFAVAGALLAPLALVAAAKGSSQIDWIPPLSRAGIRTILQTFGPTDRRIGHGPLVLGVYLLVWVSGVIVAIRTLAHRGRGWQAWSHAVPVLWLVLPLLLGIAASATLHPLLVPRYFVAALPGTALLGGVALSRLPWRGLPAAALACLLALGAAVMVGSYHNDDDGWRQVSTYLLASSLPGDGVVFAPPWDRGPVEYYWDRRHRPPAPDPLAPSDAWGLGLTHTYVASSTPGRAAKAAKTLSRVWVVVADNWVRTVSVDPTGRLVADDQAGWNLAVFLRAVAPRFGVASTRRFPAVTVFLVKPASQKPASPSP